jgi:DNA-binding MarR family transcriptional regulator
MELEKEIKQKKFASEYQKLAVNIGFTNSWLSTVHMELLKPHGISRQQFNILRILRGQHPNPASVNLLIDRMIDKMSNASRLVEKLKQKDLVERKECKIDRRQVDVVITDKGLALLKELDKSMEAFTKKMENLTTNEAKQLNDLLDKLRG